SVLSVQGSPSAGCANGSPSLAPSSPSTGPTSPATMTCERSQNPSPLTCSSGDSPAKTSARPGGGQGSAESAAVFGGRCTVLPQQCGLGTSSSKTSSDLFRKVSTPCSPPLPKSGTMRSGKLYRRAPSVPHT